MNEELVKERLNEVLREKNLPIDESDSLGDLVNKLRALASSTEIRNLMQDELRLPVVDLDQLGKERVKEIIGFPVKEVFRNFVSSCQAIPILLDGEYVLVLVTNPFDQAMHDATSLIFGKEIKIAVVDGNQLKRFYTQL
ncbi:MAG: hypothetical protein ING22_05405 [Burkholderiales bacterium]|jgi:hypothetical protein|nr:hypothetical protein [Burkholderiales bacterium]